MAKNELPMNLRDDNVSEEVKTMISSLPTDKDSQGKLCKYQGCWYYYNTLQAVINFQTHFQPQDTDIVLASFPKSGTTWLKALSIAILERSKQPSGDDSLTHPLLSENPHGIVPFFEMDMYLKTSSPDLSKFSSSSPRLFSTHMPLHTLKEGLKDSPCKVVYLCRDVKDALISRWYFRCKYQKNEVARSILETMFESFCNGISFYGPFWDHALSYWSGSVDDPKHVLFMRYEELKSEPCVQVKRLADFFGCPFTKEEEESGLVNKIVELCSLRNLSGLEINKTGKTWMNLDHNSFFRKGEVGVWKSYLTPEMVNKIDMIIEEKLKGYRCFVDGAWRESDINSGVAWSCFSDSQDPPMMGGRAIPRSLSSTHAEFEAVLWAMQCLLDLGVVEVEMATDCSDILAILSCPEEWPAFLSFSSEYSRLCLNFARFSLCLIPRDLNYRADHLARSFRS